MATCLSSGGRMLEAACIEGPSGRLAGSIAASTLERNKQRGEFMGGRQCQMAQKTPCGRPAAACLCDQHWPLLTSGRRASLGKGRWPLARALSPIGAPLAVRRGRSTAYRHHGMRLQQAIGALLLA